MDDQSIEIGNNNIKNMESPDFSTQNEHTPRKSQKRKSQDNLDSNKMSISKKSESNVTDATSPPNSATNQNEHTHQISTQNEHTPGKSKKRKSQDNPDSSNKMSISKKTVESKDPRAMSPPNSATKQSRALKNVSVDPEELHNLLEGMEEEIDDALEQAATKNKLTRTNVKNILKHVITNEYVLSMVRNTMKIENGEGNLEEAVFEPKLTRSKAKEMFKNQYALPWPVPSPMKKGDEVTQKLLQEEFLDESSDDEDYKPVEEEEPSDDDDTATSPRTSEVWSPRTPASESPPSPPVEKVLEHYAEDENALVIALPTFNLPAEPPSEPSEADKIALRTRSKLCLNDTPLEEIEASFFAPNISVDMYDTACDDADWWKFLSDYSKPIESDVAIEQVEDVDDPEYNAQEDDDSPDPLDLIFDQTTRVSRNELNALMAEIMEYTQQEYMDIEDEEEEENKTFSEAYESVFSSAGGYVETNRCEWMNSDEKMQLDEQMRMYVQLLTQSYLLSHGIPDLNFINISAKLFLDEIKMFASRQLGTNRKSAFYAHNLDNALAIINKFDKQKVHYADQPKEPLKFSPVPSSAKRTIALSKVFIYPELLPVHGFQYPVVFRKSMFTDAEDNLIALGLEQFSSCESKLNYIQSLLVPSKTIEQISRRIKNCKGMKIPLENPIKYYFTHNVAPQFPRIVRIFDPDNVKVPAEFPSEILPNWMRFYCRVLRNRLTTTPQAIAPSPPKPHQPSKPVVPIIRPMFRKQPERRKSRLILPHGAVFSPLKQITPILKKYSLPKRTVTVLPFTVTCPLKEKCQRSCKNSCPECPNRLRVLKPKRILDTNVDSLEKVITSVTDTESLVKLGEITAIIKKEVPVIEPVPIASSTLTLDSKINNVAIVSRSPDVLSSPEGISNVPVQTENYILPVDIESSVVLAAPLSASNRTKEPSPSIPSCSKLVKTEACSSVIGMEGDEAVEEATEDETDSPAVTRVAAIVTKKQTVSRRKIRVHRDLESSLALLKPTMMSSDPKKEDREMLYANSYLLRAAECLKGEPEIWNLFLLAICKYQFSNKLPVKLYLELKVILKNHPALLDDFVAFLKPAEAEFVGKYKQYLMLNKIREFLRKVEVHFSNQPHHIPRIVRALSQFRQQSYVTSAEALSGLLPLLRNQSHLTEELLHLIPDAAPPV